MAVSQLAGVISTWWKLTVLGLLLISIVQDHADAVQDGQSRKDGGNTIWQMIKDVFAFITRHNLPKNDPFLGLLNDSPHMKESRLTKLPETYAVQDFPSGKFQKAEIDLARTIWNGLYGGGTIGRLILQMNFFIKTMQQYKREVLVDAITLLLMLMVTANSSSTIVDKHIVLCTISHGSSQYLTKGSASFVIGCIRNHYELMGPIEHQFFSDAALLNDIDKSPAGEKPYKTMLTAASNMYEQVQESNRSRKILEAYIIAAGFNAILVEQSYSDVVPAFRATIAKLKVDNYPSAK